MAMGHAAMFSISGKSEKEIHATGMQMPLAMVSAGERVKVQSIRGKDDVQRFLRNLGFVENTDVTVISELNGNVIVNVKGTRVAISKSMANRVITV